MVEDPGRTKLPGERRNRDVLGEAPGKNRKADWQEEGALHQVRGGGDRHRQLHPRQLQSEGEEEREGVRVQLQEGDHQCADRNTEQDTDHQPLARQADDLLQPDQKFSHQKLLAHQTTLLEG